MLVSLMKPAPGEVIQDPAAGTGGFLIAADHYMRAATDGYFELSPKQQAFQLKQALQGFENVPDTFRLLLMNLHLHNIDPDNLDLADTLSPAGSRGAFKNADLILTNPPFGPAGGPPTRDDLTITDRVSPYQFPFVEHCIRALRLGGRAAISGQRTWEMRSWNWSHRGKVALIRKGSGQIIGLDRQSGQALCRLSSRRHAPSVGC